MSKYKNNTKSVSRKGYICKTDANKPDSFVYVGNNATSALGVIAEAVPYRKYAEIITQGEAYVYVNSYVKRNDIIRTQKSENITAGGCKVARAGDAPYLKVGIALESGRGLVRVLLQWGYVTSWDTLNGKPTVFPPDDHAHGYEPANENIQTHVASAHAPPDAQKNSDITKEEIEAKLTGEISSHSHAVGGGSLSCIICTKSSSVNQNVGGSNGTEVYWTWDGETRKDSDFTHSTSSNSERVTVNSNGWYQIRFVGNVQQGGGARSTLHGIIRVNGGSTQRLGSVRDYSRGSGYGNLSPGLDCIMELSEGDYIEVGTRIEDTDSTYTLSTNGGEINDDENLLMIIKLE